MKKRMTIMLISVAIFAALMIGYHIFGTIMLKQHMDAMKSAIPTVSTSKAVYAEWQKEFSSVGSLRAVKGADLSIESGGIVDKIEFDSGMDVKDGDVLVRLRTEEDEAKLQSYEAALKLAEVTYQRDLEQLKAQAVSQAAVDASEANLASAKAQVRSQNAIVEKKVVRAPFAGTSGLRNVDIGQYVAPGTVVTTLQQIDPIYVDFTLSEKEAEGVAMGQKIVVRADASPEESYVGKIESVNPKVDTDTRSVQMRGLLKNTKRRLLPGMFARISVDRGEAVKYLTIPQTAITYNPYGSTVYIVEEKPDEKTGEKKLVVRQTFVTTGDTRGDQVALLSGVNEGDLVVTSGQMKLQNGATVTIDNQLQLTNDADPTPKDE